MIYRQKPQKPRRIKTASKTKTNMKNYIRGFFFCAMWYMSIIAGFFLLICPVLPLVFISPKKYRKWSDRIFGLWEPFPVAMMEICFGIRVVLSGDKINPFEGALFVMNHRTRVDWNFLWMGLFHCCQPNAHNMKYILKSSLMHVPGPGWVMQTCSFIFIHRNWARDKPLLNNIIEYLNESDNLYQILIFPEGTDLTENNIKKSHNYAQKNNLEKYYKVLHPRTTGFTFIANKMKSGGQLKAIYDVTVAYPKTIAQTEADLFCGKFPEEVHFNVKRYSSSNIPSEEEELKSWLHKIWKEKEQKLHRFYSTGCFTGQQENDILYNLGNEEVYFQKMSVKNGVMRCNEEGDPNPVTKKISILNATRKTDAEDSSLNTVNEDKPPLGSGNLIEPPAGTSYTQTEDKPLTETQNENFTRNHINYDDIYKSKHYRPSHLLYLALVFWTTLIILTIHLLCFNVYLQIWVLTHSLLFVALSFVSNGFHHFAAAVYFYKYNKTFCFKKKLE